MDTDMWFDTEVDLRDIEYWNRKNISIQEYQYDTLKI